MNFLKKDSFLLGILLGLVVPLIIFVLIYFPSLYVANINHKDFVNNSFVNKIQLLSLCLPLLLFRYYSVNKKFDKAGKGIILSVLLYTIIYFYFTL